jgi:hypothetical protein
MNADLMGDFNPPPDFCQVQGRFGFSTENVLNYSIFDIADMRSQPVSPGMVNGRQPGL